MRQFRPQLIISFVRLMASIGQPIERIETQPEGRGPKRTIFKITTSNKTIILRTSSDGWLMAHAKSADPNADMTWVDAADFVGFIYLKPGAPNRAIAYLVPTLVANEGLRAAKTAYLASPPTRGREADNMVTKKLSSVCFLGDTEKPWYGFAQRWQQYRVGEINLEPAEVATATELPPRPLIADIVARHKTQLAAETGFPEFAIHIRFGD